LIGLGQIEARFQIEQWRDSRNHLGRGRPGIPAGGGSRN